MGHYFNAGGLFMTPLTIIGLAALVLAAKKMFDVFGRPGQSSSSHRASVSLILQLGILSFFLGILSQAIGLIYAFQAIEELGTVSPAMLAGGLNVSMIAPVYGLLILIFTFIVWAVLKYKLDGGEESVSQ
ncbi:MAG: MotA/TolQ/ExbB proton channel family protein [Rhodothermales bacterium]